jgi:hypothetical protein
MESESGRRKQRTAKTTNSEDDKKPRQRTAKTTRSETTKAMRGEDNLGVEG